MITGVIIGIILMLLTEFVHVLCFKYINNYNLNINKNKIILLFFVSLINFINNFYNVNIFKILISFTLLVLLNYIWFKKNLKETILTCIIISIFSMVIEFIICYILALFIKDVNQLNKMLFLKYGITIILMILLYMFFSNKLIRKKTYKLVNYLEKKITVEFIFIITIVLLNLILIRFNIDYKNNMNNIFNAIILFFVSILIVNILKINYKNEIYMIKSKDLQEKINKYEQIIDDYKELKHNLNNDLLAIKSISSKKSQKLIDEKLKKYNKNYEWINNFDKMPKGLQGLIYLKLEELKKRKLNIEINSSIKETNLKKLTSKQYSYLCDVIGIVLDNAIYASEKTKEKVIYIEIKQIKNNLILEFINTFNNEIDLNKIGQKNYSTKNKKGGLGLNYIEKTAKKEVDFLSLKKEVINNLFKVTIKVK